jgi:uncharacterized protein
MNKKTTIGIDIDGTLTAPDFWVEELNKQFNKNYKYGESDIYDWRDIYEIDNDQFMKYYSVHGPQLHVQAKIRPDAAKVINNWQENYNLCYITARQHFLTQATAVWLKKHKLPGEFYVLGSHYKLNKAKELNCQIFIEDNYDVACRLADGGINVLLMDCVYNRKPLPQERVTRVFSWQEVAKQVAKISAKYLN